MIETKRPATDVANAMAEQNVLIGRIWPVWPTKVRVTIGTQEEMAKFDQAVGRIMG